MAKKDAWDDISLQQILDSFYAEYPHEVPLKWFDREPKVTIDIDVYSKSFPSDRGYIRFRNGPFKLLVLRTELSDSQKADAVEDFLGISGLEIHRRNTAKNREYADLYDDFKREVELRGSYLDRMLESRYARHFYSQEEINRAYAQWS